MAEGDFTALSDGLDVAAVSRGVTAGIAKPNGGGTFVYGWNSLGTSVGACGLFTNLTNFSPMAKGGTVRGALMRGVSGGRTGFAPFLFICCGGSSVLDQAYMLGLGDADPSHIVLKKGTIVGGLTDAEPDPDDNGVLLRSNGTVLPDEWRHLRLDAVVNDNGDVILQVFESDLTVNAVTAPSWAQIAGMTGTLSGIDGFVDDALQVATGSAPLTSGRAGFAFQTSAVTRRGFVDHVEIARQT